MINTTKEVWKDIVGYEGLKSSNINRALKGGLRQVGGYVFEYA